MSSADDACSSVGPSFHQAGLAACSQEDWQHRFLVANFQEWRDFSPPNACVLVKHLKVAQCLLSV